VDRFQKAEAKMTKCDVCGSTSFRRKQVEEVFHLGEQFVVVEGIPARVCDRCGDATFDRETTESIRRMVHGAKRPTRRVNVDVFAYA
jgi:YgiT-type zinc finger domain-containing protein